MSKLRYSPIVLPPPPSTAGFSNPFARSELIETSRRAMGEYGGRHRLEAERYGQAYPWRWLKARHTGLPAFLPGFRDLAHGDFVPGEGGQAIKVAQHWLADELRQATLFGRREEDVHGLFRPTTVVEQHRKKDYSNEGSSAAHVYFQQYQNEQPVYGGELVVHLASSDPRVSLTSSYFPTLEKDLPDPHLSPKEALVIARTALAAHLAEAGVQVDDEWSGEIAPYRGHNLIILPFAGVYCRCYRVEISSPVGEQTWRLFINATNGDVLGLPENKVAHAEYYHSTANRLTTPPASTLLSAPEVQALATDIASFARLHFHADAGGADINLNQIEQSAVASAQLKQEIFTVAFHARGLYNHFVQVCGVIPTNLQGYQRNANYQAPGLSLLVGQGGSSIQMGFNSASNLHPKVITFQTDQGAGLASDGIDVFAPTLDPEVVWHEVAHGLMWLLNPSPFDQVHQLVPFGKALTEGYATYFARSLAARQDNASDLWARAAYRENEWHDRWSLSRPNKQLPGEDLLPAPNLYPHGETEGLPVYDVGMIWARALWDVRQLLNDADLADELALTAYLYLAGWVTSFEMAAEAVLDAARKKNLAEPVIDQLIDALANRGILAERGIQTLASSGNRLLAGDDAGLMSSTDGGNTWQDWAAINGGGRLSGVVGLVADGNTIYAATENGIFQRSSGQNNWSPLGQWPANRVPFCLVVEAGVPYVGTSRGVFSYDQANQSWAAWGQLTRPVLQLADMVEGQRRYGALVADVQWRSFQPGFAWQADGAIAGALIISVAATAKVAYVGTLNHGIWKQENGTPGWAQFVQPGDLDAGAVLCLTITNNQLLIGTTAGLFAAALGGNTAVPMAIPLPQAAAVTVILPIVSQGGLVLLVGTTTRGLWRRDVQGQWQRMGV